MKPPVMRKAFSMITAIFVIVIMSAVAALVLSLSGKMVKATTIQYRTEQAALLARSYAELAVQAVIMHDRNTTSNCVEDINTSVNNLVAGSGATSATPLNGGGYGIGIQIHYLGNNLPCSSSRILNSTPITTDYNTTMGAADALAAILVDVYVRYKDPEMVAAYKENHSGTAPGADDIPWITYHTRRLLKI